MDASTMAWQYSDTHDWNNERLVSIEHVASWSQTCCPPFQLSSSSHIATPIQPTKTKEIVFPFAFRQFNVVWLLIERGFIMDHTRMPSSSTSCATLMIRMINLIKIGYIRARDYEQLDVDEGN
jgi:hypothetical protein